MNGRHCDIAIVGGGLAGGLIAAALAAHRPDITLRLIESGHRLGGNHRWSWFASDLAAEGTALLQPFAKAEWNSGYDVAFPGLGRHLPTPYRSLASADFDAGLHAMLPPEAILADTPVAGLDAAGVTLADGQRIDARAVIDCRGLQPSANLNGGWQVFLGHHIRTHTPHGIDRPMIMDASVHQHAVVGGGGAYRFVYILPLSADELFIEDTYYADSPELDEAALAARIDAYCAFHGLEGDLIGSETGVLPVITGGNFAAFQAEHRIDGVARAGARGGFVHPLTSYTIPFAVETALTIARSADLPGSELAEMLDRRARSHWRATGFYRLLGRMLFDAAVPDQRWRIFQRFYGLSPNLIERFYAGRSTTLDRARILCGKPPVPVGRAVSALLRGGTPMAQKRAA